MITTTEFRLRYEEFSDDVEYTDPKIQLFIDDAVMLMSDETRWFDWYNIAQAALVGHLLTVSTNSESGDTGTILPVKRQEVDDVMVEHAIKDVSITELDYLTTVYGQTYYRYVRMTFMGMIGV